MLIVISVLKPCNHLAKNCPTKIKCHDCDASHHLLLCRPKQGDRVHSSDETITFKFNSNPSFSSEQQILGLVRLRPNKAVNVSRAPHSRDSGVPNGVSRLSSLVKNEDKDDSDDI